MTKKNGYFKDSATTFYGAITALVMMTAYEILILLEPMNGGGTTRNASEAWMRYLLSAFGISSHYITYFMISVALLLILFSYRQGLVFRFKTFGLMILEGIFLGVLTSFVIRLVMVKVLYATSTQGGAANLGLAIGAGLFEELVFRVFLIWILLHLLRFVFFLKWPTAIASVIIASFLFSLYHYVGPYSDPFEFYSFFHRFLGGLWLTSIYYFRGFGIVCLTHAFYDIYVIFF